MNREIKFRCFNEGTGKMIDLYKITPLALDANLNSDGLFIPFKEGYKLMQFTGLHDKNGKDIYEGDIVRPNPMHITCDCQVIFKEGAFMLKTIVHSQAHFLRKEVWNACEVLGNQYESPELINNK